MASIGVRREIMIEPWFERRARSCSSATRTRPCRCVSLSGPWPLRSTSRPDAVAVTRISSGVAGGGQGPRNRPRGRQGPVHRSGEQRAGVDFNYVMRARLHESGGWPALHVACVKGCAPAPRAMGIGKVSNRDCKPRPPQGAGDKIAFPSRIRVRRKRLHRAAAATRKIAAERRDPARARGQHLDQCAPRAIDFGGDRFTSQGIGDIDQALRPCATPSPRAPSRSMVSLDIIAKTGSRSWGESREPSTTTP
jgi:hypothetical protein